MRTERKIPVEVYSRVVGYYQPVEQWNKGKKSEWDDRYLQDTKKIVQELKDEQKQKLL